MSVDDNDRSTGPGEDDVLVAEYALGLLDAETHRAVARRIAAEPALAARLRFWRSRFSGLDGEYAPERVPAALYQRVENRVFGGPQRRGLVRFWHDTSLWRGLAAASLAVAVFAVSFSLSQPRPVDPQQFAVQLVAALKAHEGSGVEFVALYDEGTGKVRLTSLSGAAVPEKDYELWYIKGDDPAVSMGVIPVDQRTEIQLPPDARSKFGEGITLAVTLEQKGGSPTGVAQGPIVAVGNATLI
jgi:anti-sigma-K factor RskA